MNRQVDRLIQLALEEDVGTGDRTSLATIGPELSSDAFVVAKQDLVLAGIAWFARVFELVDPTIRVQALHSDGDTIPSRTQIARVSGPARGVLTAERTALNILQRLCGSATLTRRFVNAIAGTNAKITDTRKTTPGMRVMQKHAVRMGGGANHRFGLDSGIMIKDNHIAACGSITAAVTRARAQVPHLLRVEVEVKTLTELHEALEVGADVIMLDNMSTATMQDAMEIIAKNTGANNTHRRPLTEASGNLDLNRVLEVAQTGVDYLSVGALTHSALAADISLEFVNTP